MLFERVYWSDEDEEKMCIDITESVWDGEDERNVTETICCLYQEDAVTLANAVLRLAAESAEASGEAR